METREFLTTSYFMLENETTQAIEFWFDWKPSQDASPFSEVAFIQDGHDLLIVFSPPHQNHVDPSSLDPSSHLVDQDVCELLSSQDEQVCWSMYKHQLNAPSQICVQRRFASLPEDVWMWIENHGVGVVVCGPSGVLSTRSGSLCCSKNLC